MVRYGPAEVSVFQRFNEPAVVLARGFLHGNRRKLRFIIKMNVPYTRQSGECFPHPRWSAHGSRQAGDLDRHLPVLVGD